MRVSLALLALLLLIACNGTPSASMKRQGAALAGGDPDRGAADIAHYGCGACHTIPGIVGARGVVGPTLASLRSRMYIAVKLRNEPANLEHWIANPHAIDPQSAMPVLGVSQADAVDIAAYLYSLK